MFLKFIALWIRILYICLAYSIPKDGSCRHACEYLQYQSIPDAKDENFSKYTYEHVDASFTSKSDIGNNLPKTYFMTHIIFYLHWNLEFDNISSFQISEPWKGPLSFDWKDQNYCKNFGRKWNINLHQCKEACRKEQGCNAIVHDIKKSSCEVGSCTISIDSAPWVPGSIRGYFLTGGNINDIFYFESTF